jgi:hypothetical protein
MAACGKQGKLSTETVKQFRTPTPQPMLCCTVHGSDEASISSKSDILFQTEITQP